MKRLLALFISVTLSLSSAMGVYADDKGLADAITAAKRYITVPAERTDIDYDITEGTNGNSIISIEWSGDNGGTNVELDKDGCLLSYNDYNYHSTNVKGLSKYTSEQTKAVADSFMKTVYGENSVKFKVEETSLSRYQHTYQYNLYQNGIKVSNGYACVRIDPNTNEINDFDGIGKEFFDIQYPQAKGVIDKNTAVRALYNGEAPAPEYLVYSDYDNRKITKSAFLAFSISNKYTGVNAFTGELSSVQSYFNTSAVALKAASTDASDSADSGYTPEEIAAIEQSEGLINKQKATEIIKSSFPIAKSAEFISSKITKNSYTGEYYIRISGNNVNATLNASTGKVISFSYYDNRNFKNDASEDDITPIPEDKARATAVELVGKLAPTEAKQTDNGTVTSSSYDYGNTIVSFTRVANGYKCPQNIKVVINSDGMVNGYYNGFDDKVEFPKPANVLSGDDAINALTDMFDFELVYSVDEDYSVELLYHFNDSGIMDSSSKTRLNRNGEPQKETTEAGIEDIKGHWSEKYVTALFNNGYKINDTLFRPDQAITLGELKSLFNNYSYKLYYINEATEAESADDKTITRYELAEYVLSCYDMDKLRDYPDIFVTYDYKDEIEEAHQPAVAISTAMGALTGDDKDCFNGDKTVTRAEAAVALYNILNNQ
jgi:hypothetical protein